MSSYHEDLSLEVTAGSGIEGIAETYEAWVEQHGDGTRHTYIFIDLTGLRSTGIDDVIGDDGTSNACHLGQITAEINGTIVGGSVTCLEVPAGGDPDINVYASTSATAVEADDATALAGTGILINAGDHTNGNTLGFTSVPAADEYIYLAAGAATDADYTAGKLLIHLIGTV
jgi:hypothetical protein